MSKEQNKFGHLIDEATKTPRTDKAAFVADFGGPVVVDADFARELERENKDSNKEDKKMFLRVKDGIINLNAIQYIRRTDKTVTLYFESGSYDIRFGIFKDAEEYVCALSSMLDAKKLEV